MYSLTIYRKIIVHFFFPFVFSVLFYVRILISDKYESEMYGKYTVSEIQVINIYLISFFFF